jgi:hypothetical protein
MKTTLVRSALIFVIACGSVIATGCTSCGNSVKGTYVDETGGFVLDLKSGGDATFTFAGQPAKCTYTVKDDQLSVSCMGEAGATTFTILKDGTLRPHSQLMTAMHKRK